jgi:hypothetical protein
MYVAPTPIYENDFIPYYRKAERLFSNSAEIFQYIEVTFRICIVYTVINGAT